jgi:beta-galactosidase
MEAAIEEFESSWAPREYSKPWDQCVREAMDDYEHFRANLPTVPPEYDQAARLAAYIDWACFVHPRGFITRPSILVSINGFARVWSWDHCFILLPLLHSMPEVAWDQFQLPVYTQARAAFTLANMPDLTLVDNREQVTIHGQDFQVIFAKREGIILSYKASRQEFFQVGPKENYYRAPTDIDLLMGNPPANIHKWRRAGLDRLERSVTSFEAVRVNPKQIQVRICARLCAAGQMEGIDSEIIYQVFGNGEIILENKVLIHARLPCVPRVGLEAVLPEQFNRLTFYGRGPHENYVDRKMGAAVGIYHSSVDEQFTPYVFPTECGGKEDVRWLTLTNPEGNGLMVIGLDKLHIDALHYTIQDLASASHSYDLSPRPAVILHLDGWHMGVGGDDGWGSSVHPEFLIQPGKYHFGLRLRPILAGQDPRSLARSMVSNEF